jgi:hypothetical protein
VSEQLVPRLGGIDHRLVIPEKGDGLVHLVRTGFAADAEVRDVIHARGRGLLDRHAVGDVPGDGHAQAVRLRADRFDDRRCDEAVDRIAGAGVAFRHRLLRLHGRRV